MHNNTPTLTTQTVIIGGGSAGLWLLNRLSDAGHDVILLEHEALGQGQSIAAQGIIHGGLKYALGGHLTPASSAIADMPTRWRQCLAGKGEIDLRPCRVLSSNYYMWSSAGYRSRMKTFFGSKALHGRINAVAASRQPDFARALSLPGTLYQLSDFVIDTASLLQTLSAAQASRQFLCSSISLSNAINGGRDLTLRHGAETLHIRAAHVLLCAGAGNAALLQQAGQQQVAMQRRPLHMVCVTAANLPAVYMHCIGNDFGLTPSLTITSHPLADGRNLWYLGGELAESGVQRDQTQQLQAAKNLLTQLFPSLSLDTAEWCSFRIDRAEASSSDGQRPDSAALLAMDDSLSVVWPVKLTLCPELGDRVVSRINSLQAPGTANTTHLQRLRSVLPEPPLAPLPWQAARQ